MEEAADGIAAGIVMGAGGALEALRWNWGEGYDIGCDDGEWWFRRRDGLGGKETGGSPDALRKAIIENYTFRAVNRDRAADAENRRVMFEVANPHVRIWHDGGGWHARWRVKGSHTGISDLASLTGLLDRLELLADATGEGR